jgi:hypothetical protein|tara:strand:+ start:813 stop:1220 length:408 start_codon:yes stop_codon:yes gene_type:complete
MTKETKWQKVKKLAESGDIEAIKQFEDMKLDSSQCRNRSYHNSIRVNNGKSYDGRAYNLKRKEIPEVKAREKLLAKQWYAKNKPYKLKYDQQRRKGLYFNKNLWEKWVAEGCLEDSIYLKIDKRDMEIQRREYDK